MGVTKVNLRRKWPWEAGPRAKQCLLAATIWAAPVTRSSVSSWQETQRMSRRRWAEKQPWQKKSKRNDGKGEKKSGHTPFFKVSDQMEFSLGNPLFHHLPIVTRLAFGSIFLFNTVRIHENAVKYDAQGAFYGRQWKKSRSWHEHDRVCRIFAYRITTFFNLNAWP